MFIILTLTSDKSTFSTYKNGECMRWPSSDVMVRSFFDLGVTGSTSPSSSISTCTVDASGDSLL